MSVGEHAGADGGDGPDPLRGARQAALLPLDGHLSDEDGARSMQDGRVSIVTGGGAGIGAATVLELARRGCRIVVGDIDPDGGGRVCAEARSTGAEVVFVEVDTSTPEDNERLVAAALETFGRLDVAVNNAGIAGPSAPVGRYPLEAWRRVMAINVDGVFYGMRQQIPAMLATGGGVIVNMASILGQATVADAPAYVASKHAVVGLSKQVANDYAASGIRCIAVGPGFIETPHRPRARLEGEGRAQIEARHPIGRLGRAEEIADVVAWLATDAPAFLNGAYLPVDGGYLTR